MVAAPLQRSAADRCRLSHLQHRLDGARPRDLHRRGLHRPGHREHADVRDRRSCAAHERETGLLSVAAGILIIVWPSPGVTAVAIILGAWLIVGGTITVSGAFAARRVLPGWWLLLILGLLEIPLGVLALANPGATLAALITVGGIWAVAVGVMRIVLAFEVKR